MNQKTQARLYRIAAMLADGKRQADVAAELGLTRGALNNWLANHAHWLCARNSEDQAETARRWLNRDQAKRIATTQAGPKKAAVCAYFIPSVGQCGKPVKRAGYCDECFERTKPLHSVFGGWGSAA